MKGFLQGLTGEQIAPYRKEIRRFRAGQFVVRAGERVSGFGVVLEGKVQVFREDYFGNRNLLAVCEEGDVFLEAVTLQRPENSPVGVQAITPCAVAAFDYETLFDASDESPVRARLLENLLRVLSAKVLSLNARIDVLSARTTRDKVLRYLKERGGGEREITVPFGRQALADLLCVERSALCRELSEMKKRGEIDFSGRTFRIQVNTAPQD